VYWTVWDASSSSAEDNSNVCGLTPAEQACRSSKQEVEFDREGIEDGYNPYSYFMVFFNKWGLLQIELQHRPTVQYIHSNTETIPRRVPFV